jgi:agmatinase
MDAPIPFAGCFSDEADPTLPLVFVGLPCDVQSAFCRGSAEGPSRIRLGYDGRAYNSTTELGVDVAGLVADLGDWEPAETWEETRQRYREEAEALFAGGPVPFFAGGDHAVTMPLVEALAILDEPVHVVQLDAHPDLYPEYDGDRWSHACVAARILDCEHVWTLTQIGVRTLNHPQLEVARRHAHRLSILEARDGPVRLSDVSHIPEGAPVYLTVDLDAFDPAFAPGVSHPVPGGLTPRQALGIVQDAPWRLVGMDVVEVSPRLDVRDRTAVLAARLLHEAMGRVVEPDD